MTFCHGPRLCGAASLSARAPRRVLHALGLGLALSLAGLAALAAGARGNFIPLDGAQAFGGQGSAASRFEAEPISVVRYGEPAGRRRHDDDDGHRRNLHASIIHMAGFSAAPSGGQPVCVRLCDGYFFPLPTLAGDVASQGAACNSQCPDAPMEVYFRHGAEKIEDAVSASGRLYSALPVSLRYRATSEPTCTCHRDPIAYAPLKDATLRHGDAVMTPAGFMVFRGVEGAPHGARDFAALNGAGLGPEARDALQSMERASLGSAHPTLHDWFLSQNTPSSLRPQATSQARTQVAMRSPATWQAPIVVGGGKIRLMNWREREE